MATSASGPSQQALSGALCVRSQCFQRLCRAGGSIFCRMAVLAIRDSLFDLVDQI